MGALENTVVVFLSDNGASAEILVRGDGHDPKVPAGSAGSYLCLGPGWSTVSNTPFRRHKIWVHEGGISTPLIVHWPAGIPARGVWRQDVGHVIDLVPTLVDVAGGRIEPTDGPELPGHSLMPTIRGTGSVERDALYWHHDGNRAIRLKNWKLVSAKNDADTWRLYDLASDRCEGIDLAGEEPDRVRALSATWQAMDDRFRSQAKPSR
jgi:arylsulfatase